MSTTVTSDHAALAWVIVDGMPRHVSEFAGLPARRRPSTFCHTCGERLVLKLGDVRRHHAAHRPGATCPTTHPETALHSDCKLALAAALRGAASAAASLTFRVTCAGDGRESCSRASNAHWTGGWDGVRVERRVNPSSQPDIVLLRDGDPVGALEIVVSHPIEAAASDALAGLGIPWVEIDADPIRRESTQWDLAAPLDARRVNDLRPWRCDVHASVVAMREGRRLVREAPPAECVRSTTLRGARVVDLYHPAGGHERFIYRVVEERVGGEGPGVLRLLRGNLEIAAMAGARSVSSSFRADVAKLRRNASTVADSPMQWAHGAAAEFITMEAVFDRRRPDPTVLATTYPRRWFYSPVSGEWFLPDDMRDVRWDRAEDDVLAPHPASRRRVSGRVSAAPEGSWSTFIFARRPSTTAFGVAATVTELVPGVARLEVELERHGRRRASPTHRAVFLVTSEIDDATFAAAIERVRASGDGADALWLSHPRDWKPIMGGVSWAPSGCDSRGRGAVVVDGVGVLRADAFLRAIARGDSRFSAPNVLRAMAARVQRLAARPTG